MTTTTVEQKPTARQLAYLRALAHRTGQTFTCPQTKAQASAQIKRLKATAPSTRIERRIERDDLAAERAAREMNCDVPIDLDDEAHGYGSTATWGRGG